MDSRGLREKRPLADVRPFGPFIGGRDVPMPSTNETAVFFFTPTNNTPSRSDLPAILDESERITGSRPGAEAMDNGIMFKASESSGRGKVELPHVVLDVTESVAHKRLGGGEKSTLFAANPGDATLQGCFNPVSGTLSQSGHEKINTDVGLVAGVKGASEQVKKRIYYNTTVTTFHHNDLDVMELATSRVAFDEGVGLQNNAALIREPNRGIL